MKQTKNTIRKIFSEDVVRPWGAKGAVWSPVTKPFDVYFENLSKRNIFQPYEDKVVKKAEKTDIQTAGIERIAEAVKDYKLVGISWLDTPDSASAMIENTTSGTTYFLGEGDKIQNVTVKKIFADSVVISYGQDEMELKL